MRKINKIIIHCSATRECQDISAATIREWHLARGWSDIGYHYVVGIYGNLETGRAEERVGAHVSGHNKNSIGICYVGGCDANMKPKDTRTDEQRNTLDILIKYLMKKYPEATLHGHNEYSSKACPSFDVQLEYSHLIN